MVFEYFICIKLWNIRIILLKVFVNMFFLCYNLSANEEWGFPLFNVILGGALWKREIVIC